MKTLTVKIPDELDLTIRAVAEKRGESKSVVVRTALENFVSSSEAIAPNSCLELVKDLVGTMKGPEDLSHNKKYLKGYGQ